MQTWRERAGNGTLEHAINKTVRKLSRSDSTRVQLKHTLKSVISSGSRAEGAHAPLPPPFRSSD